MGMEMAAARLLLPFYGDSHLVWANLIGVVLAALSGGYYAGGRLADRVPSARLLVVLMGAAGLWIAAIPRAGQVLLPAMARGLPPSQAALVGGSLVAVVALFALPAFFLGCVLPAVIRLSLADVELGGRIAGRTYAVLTVGSMVGTFVPVLWLMPVYGVRSTFAATAGMLLVVATIGVIASARIGRSASIEESALKDFEQEVRS